MTPKYWEAFALRNYPHRWQFGVTILIAIAIIAVAMITASRATVLLVGLAWPVLVMSWGLFCMTFWFHPENGTLRPGVRFLRWMPEYLSAGVRWFYAVVMSAIMVAAAIAGPIFAVRIFLAG